MADDVLLNKAAAIERAVRRAREEHGGDDANLLTHQTRQDAIILNLQRACDSSIDAAMHLVRLHRLGVPQESREAFEMLEKADAWMRTSRGACGGWWASATWRYPTISG